jgi:hypothetical protein
VIFNKNTVLGGSEAVASMAEPCPGRARDRLCNGGHEGQKQCQGLLGYLSNYWRHQGDYAESRELPNSKGLEDAKPYSAQLGTICFEVS